MPSTVSKARTAGDTWLERLTRAGFIGYGIVHLLFAYVIARIAFGRPAQDGDQSGAMQRLAEKPWGAAVIVAIVVGLVAMALWQIVEIFAEHTLVERIASVGRAAFYLYLSFNGVKVLRGKTTSSADTQQHAAEGLLGSTLGRLTVGGAGIVVAAIGVGLAIVGITRRFEKHLKVRQMSAAARRLITRLGVVGYTAKGLAYGIAGVLFVAAAVQYDPKKARGLDAALTELSEHSYGMWLLLLTAIGFVAYGLFSIAESRYRKV